MDKGISVAEFSFGYGLVWVEEVPGESILCIVEQLVPFFVVHGFGICIVCFSGLFFGVCWKIEGGGY